MPLQILIKKLFAIETQLAVNGEEAVLKFKKEYSNDCKCPSRGYIFIFMDLQMPVKDGFDASREILAMTAAGSEPDFCRIVALTSYTSEEVR